MPVHQAAVQLGPLGVSEWGPLDSALLGDNDGETMEGGVGMVVS